MSFVDDCFKKGLLGAVIGNLYHLVCIIIWFHYIYHGLRGAPNMCEVGDLIIRFSVDTPHEEELMGVD